MTCNHYSILSLWSCDLPTNCMHKHEGNSLTHIFMQCGNGIEESRVLLEKRNERNKIIKCESHGEWYKAKN